MASKKFTIQLVKLMGTCGYSGPALGASPVFVKAYDPDHGGGVGLVTGTVNRDEARQFVDGTDAWVFSRQISSVKPTRADGEPNRPMLAFTLDIAAMDQAQP